jgi:Fic family protein
MLYIYGDEMNENVMLSDKEKLEILLANSEMSKAEVSRYLEVSYNTVYRWLNRGIAPHPAQSRHIDELFRKNIDRVPIIEDSLQNIPDPVKIINENPEIKDKLFIELTYNSCAIKGSRVSRNQVAAIYNGEKVRGRDFFEVLEVVNHKNALISMIENVHNGYEITEEYIMKLHSIIIYDLNEKFPGKYRNGPIDPVNTEVMLPSYEKVPQRMKLFIEHLITPHFPLLRKTALAHHDFQSIQPFFDGNGRLGRLVTNTQLLALGYPPAIFTIEDRSSYYQALSNADKGDFNMLSQVFSDAVIRGYELVYS